jgi:hypothetical protein
LNLATFSGVRPISSKLSARPCNSAAVFPVITDSSIPLQRFESISASKIAQPLNDCARFAVEAGTHRPSMRKNLASVLSHMPMVESAVSRRPSDRSCAPVAFR